MFPSKKKGKKGKKGGREKGKEAGKKEEKEKQERRHFECHLPEEESGILITFSYATRLANNFTVILRKLKYL